MSVSCKRVSRPGARAGLGRNDDGDSGGESVPPAGSRTIH